MSCKNEKYTFECKHDKFCIGIKFVCDGVFDCFDKSDEEDCPISYVFKCENKNSISINQVCDFEDDCGDSSDEKDCS